ncbi:MAG: pyridoxamine 5'-phosphate oxidase family protein [Brevundimonas sp.]
MTEHLDRKDVEERLFKAIEDTRVGMLGVSGGEPRHMQPMTAYVEREAGELWFYTYRDTDLVRDVNASGGHHAMFCLISKDREIYACMGGRLEEHFDRERMERYWNPVVAAWYPEGKDDPRLTLVRMTLDDAQVWVSEAGPVRFAFEIAKANMTHEQPDLGDRADIRF